MRSLEDVLAPNPRRAALVCFGLGAFMGLGNAPFGVVFAQLISLPLLAWLCVYAITAKRAFWIGWFAGTGYFLISLNWLVEPFLVDAARHAWMAPFAVLFMAGGLALFWGGAFYCVARFPVLPSRRLLILACLWVLAEFLRARVFTGFPWAHISHAWIDLPLAQITALVGMHGLFLILLLICFYPLMAPQEFGKRAATSLAILAVLFAYGVVRQPSLENVKLTETVVRVVQPNAEQHLKWRDDMIGTFYNRHLSLISRPSSKPIDVVVLSETAMPYLLGTAPEATQKLADAAGPETQVIFGIRHEIDDGRFFNSLAHLDQFGGLLSVYDKHHLVPFGEYIPLSWVLPRFGFTGLVGQGYSRGSGKRVLKDKEIPSFLPLICYEAIFPQHSRTIGTRPEWIVHATNDAWFGKFSGPYQHLAQTRLRAIEQGLPVARAANTGISAIIDPYGRVMQSIPLGKAGILDAQLPEARKRTLYGFWGELPWLIFVLGVVVFTLFPIGRAVPRDLG